MPASTLTRLTMAKISPTSRGESPSDGSSRSSSLGLAISARAIASICCSPPDRLRAGCSRRSRRMGK